MTYFKLLFTPVWHYKFKERELRKKKIRELTIGELGRRTVRSLQYVSQTLFICKRHLYHPDPFFMRIFSRDIIFILFSFIFYIFLYLFELGWHRTRNLSQHGVNTYHEFNFYSRWMRMLHQYYQFSDVWRIRRCTTTSKVQTIFHQNRK